MEVEHEVKVFKLDDQLEANIQSMNQDGWLMLPGVAPVAVYHVVRMKGATQQQTGNPAVAKVSIDETKVHLYRDGKPVSDS